MITVIAGTNRPDSMTLRLAGLYHGLLSAGAPGVRLLSLQGRQVWERGPDMLALEKEYLLDTTLFVFVMPEYNGSFPGVLKMMLDNSDIQACYYGKKAALVGLADGRAGNLRGLDHMTNILNYLQVEVWRNKLPVSRIFDEIKEDGTLKHAATAASVQQQVDEVLAFYGRRKIGD